MRLRSVFILIIILCFHNFTFSQEKVVNDTTYMLTYDHGGLILWGSGHFRERLNNAVEWLDKYPSFKIGLDNEAQIYDYFAENEPSMIKELNNLLVKYKDRFGIGSCTYGQPLSQFITDESNIRQIAYALEAERKYFNYRPPVYLMSEHAMHSQIPQILNGFGFSGAIMRTHFMMYGYNPTFDVPIGWWIGVDGSRIKTIPTYTGEGAEFGKTPVDNWILTRYPGNDSREPMESFRKKFSHIIPLLASRADDSGLRKEELVKEYEAKPKFKWILLDDILAKYPLPVKDMPTKPDDFKVRMPWGYCGNIIWNESRKAEISVLTAERLNAIEVLNGGISREKLLDASWKSLLLAQHHDIQICGLLSEAEKLLPASLSASQSSISESMKYFSGRMSGEGLNQVTVFNPLSWRQTKWINAYVSLQKGTIKSIAVKCGTDTVPVRIVQANRYSDGTIMDAHITFRAEMDPLTLYAYSVIPALSSGKNDRHMKYDERNLTITSPYYVLKLSSKGGIASITDAETKESITSGLRRSAFFAGKIDGMDCQSEGKWIIERSTEETPWVKAVEHGFIADIPYTFEITVYEDNPRIDCRAKFDFNGQKIGLLSDNQKDSHSPFVHEDKLRFKFFPGIDTAATAIRDLPFTISETPDKNVEGNYWNALSDGRSGIAFFNKGNMGSIREKDNSFSIPLAYAMYYIWGTRMLYGSYDYEFALLPFRGNWKDAELQRKALEYSFETPVMESRPSQGSYGDKLSTFKLNEIGDVLMTALYPQKENIIARFFKSGDAKPVTSLNFEQAGAKMTEITLDGKFVKDITEPVYFTPWQIRTFRLNLKSAF